MPRGISNRRSGKRRFFIALTAAISVQAADSVAAAHRLGLEVHAWTINEEREMEALLDLGADGIMTDFPARGFELFRRHGLR